MALNILYQTVNALSSVSSYQLRVSFLRGNIVSQTRSHARCYVTRKNPLIKVSEEVREAVRTLKPVVALETAIYTHGG